MLCTFSFVVFESTLFRFFLAFVRFGNVDQQYRNDVANFLAHERLFRSDRADKVSGLSQIFFILFSKYFFWDNGSMA